MCDILYTLSKNRFMIHDAFHKVHFSFLSDNVIKMIKINDDVKCRMFARACTNFFHKA